VDGYEGAVLVPPGSPEGLRDGIGRAAEMAGRTFPNRRDWAEIAPRYAKALDALTAGVGEA
jgi:hypothetical protein